MKRHSSLKFILALLTAALCMSNLVFAQDGFGLQLQGAATPGISLPPGALFVSPSLDASGKYNVSTADQSYLPVNTRDAERAIRQTYGQSSTNGVPSGQDPILLDRDGKPITNPNELNQAIPNGVIVPQSQAQNFGQNLQALQQQSQGLSSPPPNIVNQLSNNRPQKSPLGTVVNVIGNIFLLILDFVFGLLGYFLGIMLSFAGNVVDFVFSIKTIAGSQVVQTGWTFTRDTLNFVYILVLLAIAFGTIVDVGPYGIRQTLPRLLVSALLVNFSLSIAGAFIQISNVITQSIVDSKNIPAENRCTTDESRQGQGVHNTQLGSQLSCALANGARVWGNFSYGPVEFTKKFGGLSTGLSTFGRNGPGIGGSNVILFEDNKPKEAVGKTVFDSNITAVFSTISALVFIGMFTAAMCALAVLLVVRLVALVLLLVLAPIPYALGLIPQAAGYAGKWWSYFIQYTFFLPAVAFFLILATRIMASGSTFAEQFKPNFALLNISNPSQGGVVYAMFSTFFMTVFMLVAMSVAKSLGVYGADTALSLGKKMTGGPALWARTGKPFIGGFQEGRKKRDEERKTSRLAQLGALVGGGSRTSSKMQQRNTADAVKDMETRGANIVALQAKATKGQGLSAAEAMYLEKKKELKKSEHYEAAMKAVGVGSQSYTDMGKAYQQVKPWRASSMLVRAGKISGTVEEAAIDAWRGLEEKNVIKALKEPETLGLLKNQKATVSGKHAKAILDSGDEELVKILANAKKSKDAEATYKKTLRDSGSDNTPPPSTTPPGYTLSSGAGGGRIIIPNT